ncbi:MAG: signal peptide peptidase SppA, partial [Bacteroidota bacterium]
VLQLDLNREITERTSKNPLESLQFGSIDDWKTLGLNDIIKNIDKAKRDTRIKGIFLNMSSVQAGGATIEEIRTALIDFKKSGKFIYSYGEVYGQGAYYLASVSDKMFVHPEGMIDFRGMSMELMFFKGALEKLEVEPQIIRHGKFKSAVEPFLLDKMSPENREQLETLSSSVWGRVLEGISESRKVPVERLQLLADTLVGRDAQASRDAGLVDVVCYYDEFLLELRKKSGWSETEKEHLVKISSYDNAYVKSEKPYSSDKIAVIYAVGDIVDGKGDDRTIGGATTSAELRKARKDSSVKAVVLRINSPGGSALASDVIWREVELTRKVKPVIASMGDYAASGGYYIACAADSIVADRNTITGSIGVFGLMFNAQKMFNNKLGVTFDTVKTGRNSDIGSMTRPMRPEEREIIQSEVEKTYQTFIGHVADGRKMSKDAVDSIGQGRVWSGTDGKRIGLVDKYGDLQDAIAMAARMAKLDNYRISELPRQKEIFEVLMSDFSEEVKSWMIRTELGTEFRYYESIREVTRDRGILTRLPFGITLY